MICKDGTMYGVGDNVNKVLSLPAITTYNMYTKIDITSTGTTPPALLSSISNPYVNSIISPITKNLSSINPSFGPTLTTPKQMYDIGISIADLLEVFTVKELFDSGITAEDLINNDIPVYLYYYPTEGNAQTNINLLGIGTTYVVGNGAPVGYTGWMIASNSTGSSSRTVVYVNGNTLDASGSYNLYPAIPCFLEGSRILCLIDGCEKYIRVEEMHEGTLVKTSLDGYKAVVLIGKGRIKNSGDGERTKNRMYKCSVSKYPELKEDLYITGCHSILKYPITEKEKEEIIKHMGELFVTDKKYRVMAFLDEKAEPWKSQRECTVWHFALENSNEIRNYGVYANGGLLVESCSINFLKNKSNMTLLCGRAY
jgi:hypothetical protein